MVDHLDDSYLHWLVDVVGLGDGVGAPTDLSYELLLAHLHTIRFEYSIVRDANRAEDGVNLRSDYLWLHDLPRTFGWSVAPASVLEVLVALAKRMDFICGVEDDATSRFFMELLRNTGLDVFTDRYLEDTCDYALIDDIIDRWMYRQYGPTGQGSVFPLAQPPMGQSAAHTELWIQMQQYITERHPTE